MTGTASPVTPSPPPVPEPGQLVRVRGTVWVVGPVQVPAWAAPGLDHLVTLHPLNPIPGCGDLQVIWELEAGHTVLTRPAPPVTTGAGARLPDLYAAFTAQVYRPCPWTGLALSVRGDVRAIWVVVRAGQTDPWLAALAGWRHRATWHHATRPAPTFADLDDLDEHWWADHRADERERARGIAAQYLAMAWHLIHAHTTPLTA